MTQIPDAAAPFTARSVLEIAPGSWAVNAWAGAELQRAADGTATRATLVTRGAGGDANLVQAHPFQKGRRYRVSMRAWASAPLTLTAFVRRDQPYYETQGVVAAAVGADPVDLSFEWQHRTADPASLRVQVDRLATFWVQDVVIEELGGGPLAAVRRDAVSSAMFGIHANRLGRHNASPQLGQGLLRLWDAGTLWLDVEKSQGSWYLTRANLFVIYAQKAPGLRILAPVGFPPAWASSVPDSPGTYGPGSNVPPRSEGEYRTYIRRMATEYRGVITHWELGNEMNQPEHWQGGPAELVRWARITREELQAVDPRNKLIGPTISGGGLLWLASFYAAGGGEHVDAIGMHGYWGDQPEDLIAWFGCARQIAQANGLTDLPIWNTEGAPTNVPMANYSLVQQRAITARGLLAQILSGVEAYAWYTMEGTANGWGLVGADFLTPTPCGEAYACIALWTTGWWVADAIEAAGTYVLKLRQGERRRYIVWRPAGTAVLSVPPGWRASRFQPLCGYVQQLPSARTLSVGIEPVMVE